MCNIGPSKLLSAWLKLAQSRPLAACVENKALYSLLDCHRLVFTLCLDALPWTSVVNMTDLNTTTLASTGTRNMSGIKSAGVGGDGEGNLSDYYDYVDFCGRAALGDGGGGDVAEVRAARALQTYLYPVLLLLATLGNLASLLLLKQLSVHAWSSCLYLAVLSLVELLVLYIRCGGEWMAQVAKTNPSSEIINLSDAMCKTYLFLSNVLLQMWPWLMVALAVELTIATRYPLKIYHMCTRERARATVLLIAILLICLNLNFFWTWGLRDVQGTPTCMYIEEFSVEFMDRIWPSIEMCVKHMLPLLAVIACVAVIVASQAPCRSAAKAGGLVAYEPILKRYFLDLQALRQLKNAALVLVLLFLLVKAYTFLVEVVRALMSRGYIQVACPDLPAYQIRFHLVAVVRDACVYSFWSLKFLVYFACCASFRRRFYACMRRLSPFCHSKKLTGEHAVVANENGIQESQEQSKRPAKQHLPIQTSKPGDQEAVQNKTTPL